jgi:hypothetical protein
MCLDLILTLQISDSSCLEGEYSCAKTKKDHLRLIKVNLERCEESTLGVQ